MWGGAGGGNEGERGSYAVGKWKGGRGGGGGWGRRWCAKRSGGIGEVPAAIEKDLEGGGKLEKKRGERGRVVGRSRSLKGGKAERGWGVTII